MTQLSTKIKIYCKNNNVNSVNFLTDVILQDDGHGPYIKEWNLDIPMPNTSDLVAVEADANKEEQNNNIDQTRKASYGSWEQQLDEIFHDIDAWKARIQFIKNNNPKVQ